MSPNVSSLPLDGSSMSSGVWGTASPSDSSRFEDGLIGAVPDVNAYPLPAQPLRGDGSCSATCERVKYDVAFVTRCLDDSLVESQWLLSRIADALTSLRVDCVDVAPERLKWHTRHLVEITYVLCHPVAGVANTPFLV